MKRLETERLVLRPWQGSDLEDFYTYARNPLVGPAAGWKPHENREESAEILDLFMQEDETWALQLTESGRVIGSVGLHKDSQRQGVNSKMLGYVLAAEHWGKGLMTEAARAAIRYAFKEERLDVLAVNHYPENGRSKRIIEKCGFVYEGTLRHARPIFDGTVKDICCYSMLQSEYEAMIANGNHE